MSLPTTSFNDSQLNQVISETSLATRRSWCTSELTTCGILCNGPASDNLCNATSLTYSCICSDHSVIPVLEYYQSSLTYFICHKLSGDCFAENAGNFAGQQACNASYVCGTINSTSVSPAGSTITFSSSTLASVSSSLVSNSSLISTSSLTSTTADGASTFTSAAPLQTSSTSNPEHGTPTSVKVGAGVGSAAAFLLLIIAILSTWHYRKVRKAKLQSSPSTSSQEEYRKAELRGNPILQLHSDDVRPELEGVSVAELHANSRPVELDSAKR